jgi:hypothetical protein
VAGRLVVGVELVVVEGADVAAYAAAAPPPSRTPVRVRAPTTFITRGLMVVHLPSGLHLCSDHPTGISTEHPQIGLVMHWEPSGSRPGAWGSPPEPVTRPNLRRSCWRKAGMDIIGPGAGKCRDRKEKILVHEASGRRP